MTSPELKELKDYFEHKFGNYQTVTEMRLKRLEELFEQRIGQMENLLVDHHKSLYGNNGSDGLRIRVDRIETTGKQLTWIVGIVASLMSGIGVFIFK